MNTLMAERKKPKINLSLLPDLLQAWNESTEFTGEKRKWMASSAAVYLWLKLTPSERKTLAYRMYDADGRDDARDAMLKELGLLAAAAKRKSRLDQGSEGVAVRTGKGTITENGVTRPLK